MADTLSATALVREGGSIPLSAADGAAHLFVDPVSGDDDNVGLSAATAFRTINRAIARANAWLELGVAADIVVELANGTYTENVDLILDQIPRGRVIMRGNPLTMTVIATGTIDAGATAYQFTDAASAFGAAQEQVGRIVEIFDPANPATTRQYKLIRNHTNTQIFFNGPASPVPLIGWTFNILEPAANIVRPATAGSFNAAMDIVLPWNGGDTGRGISEFGNLVNGPLLVLAFLRVTAAALNAINQQGGGVQYMGVVIDGAGNGINIAQGSASFQGILTTIVDRVFGTSATFSGLADCGLGVRGGSNLRLENGASAFGTACIRNPTFELSIFGRSQLQLFGGSVLGNFIDCAENSELDLFGGGLDVGGDPAAPFLFRAAPATQAVLIREKSRAEIRDILFQVCLGAAFSVMSDGYLDLRATITAGGGDVAGIGIHCQNAGKAAIAAAVTFTTGGTNIRVGNGVSANGDSTFAALTLTAPIWDDIINNGRGAAGVQPGSRAAVWEV